MSLPNLAINIIKWVKLSDVSVKIWLLMVCLQSSLAHAIMPRIMKIHHRLMEQTIMAEP
jgi:hypothetical protein